MKLNVFVIFISMLTESLTRIDISTLMTGDLVSSVIEKAKHPSPHHFVATKSSGS